MAPSPAVPAREPARRPSIGSSGGVVLMQALNSLTTLVQMSLFAIVLPREVFDDYAVWATSAMFVVGLGQAIGSDRVLVGQRTAAEGMSAAGWLALGLGALQAVVGALLGSPGLVVASIGTAMWSLWDYLRIVHGFDRARDFLLRDAGVVLLQVAAVLAADRAGLPAGDLYLVWWGLGAALWATFALRMVGAGALGRREGLGVLWQDRRESAPLLLDAALAGVPIVGALALANAYGGEGAASAARMAFTVLGPVAVLGMAVRRIVLAARAGGAFTARAQATVLAVVVAVFVVCFAILTLTRTPLYPWLLPGFGALSWLTITGFAVNHAAVMAAMLPAADLRAERRSSAIGAARAGACLAAAAFVAVSWPFDTVAHVPWCVAAASLVYAVTLNAVTFRSRHRDAAVAA